MMRRQGIAFKLALSILLGCTVIFVVIIGYHHRVSRAIIEREMADTAALVTESTIRYIEGRIRPIEDVTKNTAFLLERTALTEQNLKTVIKSFVTINPDVFGSIVAFEPGQFDGKTRNYALYFCESSPSFIIERHDFRGEEWYRAPVAASAPAWSEPYFDKSGGRIVMTTYSVPFRTGTGAHRKIRGVVTSDIALEWLQRTIAGIKVEKTGYCFLVSRKGTLLAHPGRGGSLTDNILELAGRRGDPALLDAARRMTAGGSGLVPVVEPANGRRAWLSYAPVPSCGWSLGVVFPEDEVLRDIFALNRTVTVLGFVGVGTLTLIIIVLAGTITRPLRLLADKTLELAAGNLDVELPPSASGDEVGSLTGMFLQMRDSLKRYIHDLTETTAVKERMEKELQIAREIQMSMLPKGLPSLEGAGRLELFAELKPAREVGGDFYDFIALDGKRLFFVIGDVSGKGVPAALLMFRILTILKTATRFNTDVDLLLQEANREFAACNESCLFVTVLCGILETESGEVTFASAGHEPPLLARASGEFEWLDKAKGMVLGVEEDSAYPKKSVTLRPGDTLCLYTDGVSEAFNAEREMFTRWKLMEAVSAHRDETLPELCGSIMAGIESFAAGAPQSDDITLLLLRYGRAPERGEK